MFNFSLNTLMLQIPAAFLALVLHEMVKAHCSTRQGDPTPKKSGLMSGNPLKYLEPIGFIVTVIFGFGWGRPTPTSPVYYKDRQKGILITYITPSLVNLFVGLLVALCAGIFNVTAPQLLLSAPATAYMITVWLHLFLIVFARISIGIAIFNIIPVHPLDASKILQASLSPNTAIKMTQNEKLLQLALIMLMLIGVINSIIDPITNLLVNVAWSL